MKYLFLLLFCIFSSIHLVDSWKDDACRRAVTKPFLLLFLTLFYCFSTEQISWLLLAALLTSWLGDVLLIPKGHKWFIIGGISFLVSHFLFVMVYSAVIQFDDVPWMGLAPAVLIYGMISLLTIRAVRPTTPEAMVIPMCIYLLINSAMNVFAMMLMITTKSLGGTIAYVGAVAFFLSDCILYLVRYHGNRHLIFKRHFSVMLAYLSGEFLITLGMLLLSKG